MTASRLKIWQGGPPMMPSNRPLGTCQPRISPPQRTSGPRTTQKPSSSKARSKRPIPGNRLSTSESMSERPLLIVLLDWFRRRGERRLLLGRERPHVRQQVAGLALGGRLEPAPQRRRAAVRVLLDEAVARLVALEAGALDGGKPGAEPALDIVGRRLEGRALAPP